MKQFLKDQRAGATVAIKGLFMSLVILMIIAVLIDSIYIGICYFYIKTQMDMSNRAVYAEIDSNKLADRELYIDEAAGQDKFYEYLKKNLTLDNNLAPTVHKFNIVGPVKIIGFEIYNLSELPATTPIGTRVDMVAVHSQLEIKIKPIFFGWLKDVTIKPYMDTDLPDKLVKTLHPI